MADVAEPLRSHRLRRDPVSAAAGGELTIGRRRLVTVSDGFLLMKREFVGPPDRRSAAHDVLAARYGEVRLPLGCFLVPGEPTVLVDTGFGPGTFRDEGTLVGGHLLAGLAAHGVRPGDVDIVALSHLHGDHSGTVGEPGTGRPVFPNARVYLGRGDWDWFVADQRAAIPVPEHTLAALRELDRRGQVELLDADADLAPGVRRIAAPGHTPGHSLYSVHDGPERVLLLGDAMYCPQQLTELDWSVTFDVDPGLARRTRQTLVRDLEQHGGSALGCHFPELHAARVLRPGGH